MAYAAVISLKRTIQHLHLTSSILTSSPQIKSAFQLVSFFPKELERLDGLCTSREAFHALASQIRDAAWKLEDVLDLYALGLSNHDEVEREGEIFCIKAKRLVEDCSKVEVNNDSQYGGETTTLIRLRPKTDSSSEDAFCIVGMAGIGKTTYALKSFQDSIATGNYDVHAFVAVGQKPQLKDVLLAILSQICCRDDDDHDDQINVEKKVEELGSCLYKKLSSNRFIILLDDVWDTRFWKEFSRFLPVNDRGNRVLVTTRRQVVASACSKNVHKMPFLSDKESWDLFYANAFQKDESCSSELKEVGKKIAEYCEGLPLAIITVAQLLAKVEKTVEYWQKVVNGETTVFEEASEIMSPVLLPSYLYLPLQLKMCFLYHGVFPCKSAIGYDSLLSLLEVEEFLDVPIYVKDLQPFVSHSLDEVASENVIVEGQDGTHRLHFSYWYLCVKEAERRKFYKVIRRRADAFAQGIETERRLAIQNNVLLGIKDVHKSLSRASGVRSILCTGPYHKYSVPMFADLKFLRVLDAQTIRLYEFPVQLLKLVQLRYLALTCRGKLPASISKLCNLKYLIIRQHFWVRRHDAPTYLPNEIWDMKELKHLEVMGAELPEPSKDGAFLVNLTTLKGVSGHSCKRRVLEKIPCVRMLVIFMELPPSGGSELSGSFNDFLCLRVLTVLICLIMNPHMSTPEVVQWPITVSSFSPTLRHLTLRGQGYPWTMLSKLAKLPRLAYLDVLEYACRGSKWTVSKDDGFGKLKSLDIGDTDLEEWEVEEGAFPILERLTIKHCYKLKQLPRSLVHNSVTEITLIDCNPSVAETANFPGRAKPIHVVRSF